MPKTNKVIVSLNAGELSPLMSSRFDQEKYGFGCRTLENFYPLIYGGAERRPGTQYIAGCISNDAKSRLVSFEHSVDDTYILEFGNQTMRVFRSGARVTYTPTVEDVDSLEAIGTLIALWKLDETTGTAIADSSSGYAHTGTADTDASNITATGKVGTCFDFGSTHEVEVADHYLLSFGDGTTDKPFSIAAWIYKTASSPNRIITSKYDLTTGSEAREWKFQLNSDKLHFVIYDESANKKQVVESDDDLADGAWYYVVGTYDGRGGADADDGMNLYVNGSAVDHNHTGSDTSGYLAMENLATKVLISGQYDTNGDASSQWDDKIDSVALWGSELSATSISALYSGAATTYSIVTPYLTADLFALDFKRSADVMYITHGSYEPRRLSRTGHSKWKLEELDIQDGPFRAQNTDLNITITPSAVTGSITLTATDGVFVTGTTAGHRPSGSTATSKSKTGALFKLVQGETDSYVSGLLGVEVLNAASSTLAIYKGVTWDLVTNGTWGSASNSATLVLERSYDAGTTYETVVSFTSAADYNIKTSGTEENEDAIYRLRVAEAGADTDCAYNLSVRDTGHIGIVEITAVASTVSATATVLTTLGSTDLTYRWSEGAWSNKRGWPKAVDISPEERLTFGGSSSKPLTVWGSVVGDFTSFKSGILDDDAIVFTLIGSGQQNTIRWMLPRTAMMIGTVGGEHLLGASAEDEALTPTNVQAKLQATYGSENANALIVNNAILFLQRGAKKIRELVYSFEDDLYKADDLTIFANHITESGINDMAFQRTPDPMLWCVRDDGEIAVLSYERDQNVFAWSRLVTTDSTADSDFESVAVIYGGAGKEDEVWVTVKRTINSATARYVERFKARDWGADTEDAFFVDSGVTYDSTSTTAMTGGTHLIGETVAVFADGLAQTSKTVNASGEITLDTAASVVQWGLAYTPVLIPMRLDLANLGLATTKKIPRVIVDLYKTMYGNIGTTEANVTPIVYRDAGDTTNAEFPLKTGHITHSPRGGYNRDGDIVITQDKPAPMTVLSLTFDIGAAND